MGSWIDFKKIFSVIDESNYLVIEEIIKDITVFNEKNILKKRLKNVYKLSNEQIKKILKLNYSGWSKLSYELINGIKADSVFFTPIEVNSVNDLNIVA